MNPYRCFAHDLKKRQQARDKSAFFLENRSTLFPLGGCRRLKGFSALGMNFNVGSNHGETKSGTQLLVQIPESYVVTNTEKQLRRLDYPSNILQAIGITMPSGELRALRTK